MDKPDFSIEKKFWSKKLLVAGIDEVGRGSIAGPVCASAVIFPFYSEIIEEINDSKKLSELKRNELFNLIINQSVDYSSCFVDNIEIDRINILQATMKAMNNSVENLKVQPNHLLVDGNYFKSYFKTFDTIKKGDSISVSIAAASIVAKVERDKFMVEVANEEFPNYKFDKNKGYGTKEHFEAIGKYGICKYHRKSFLKNQDLK